MSKTKSDLKKTFLNPSKNFDPLFRNSETVIYNFNLDTSAYDYISPSIVNLTGYTAAELNDAGFLSIVKEIIQNELDGHNANRRLPKGGNQEYYAKYLVETKNGKLKWLEDNALFILNSKGKPTSSVGVLRDITAMEVLVTELDEERKNLNTYLNLAEVIFLVIDKNERVKLINKKGCNILGYSKDEIIGKNWFDYFVPVREREDLRTFLRNIYAENIDESNKHVNSIITKDGEERLISWHNSVFKDENGNILSVISSGQDVTEISKEAKIQQVISNILHAANSVANLNDFLDFICKSVSELMPVDNFYIALYDKETQMLTFPYYVDQFDEAASPGKLGKGLTEYVLRTGNSALINKEKDADLVNNGETEMVGTPAAIWLGIPLKIQSSTIGVLVVQDYYNENTYGEKEKEILEVISFAISRAIERKLVENEKSELIEKLKETNKSKDKLFSLISHDLRGPFNSLLGFSEILTSEYDSLTDDEIKEYLKVIYDSSKNLYQMTNNLLQYSRFQIGRFEYNPVKLNVKRIVLNNINMLKGSAIKKQLNLYPQINSETEVYADEDMLNSILQNLISNALKFTNKGGEIKIGVNLISDLDKKEVIEISVSDTGIGIAASELDKIFNDVMFSTPGTDKEYGTGLGLLLVKEFVKKNEGKITVQSQIDEGTTVSFTLPVAS